MKFNRNVKEIGYKDKVILANCLNGYWIRLTKEIYYYFLEAVEKDIEPNMFFNMFEDQEDREYIEQIYRKMVSIAILEDKKILLPKEISIEITNKCNLNCKHCCIDANSRTDEMSTDEIYRSIRKIAKWNPDNVSISGGEPLVRRDIKEILIYLRKVYNGKITLSTNGLLIDKENIETLKKCVDYFEISLDEIDTSKEIQCLFDNNPLMSMTLNNEYQMLPTNNSLITAKFTGMICQCISKYDIQKEKYTDILQIMQKENREQKSKIYTSSQEWYMDNNDELLQAIYELLKSVLQLHKPTNNICDIELLTSRGSLRFEYVYDILSYLESRLNIKINYMTVSRYDMLTVGTLTKFFKESGREYFEKV